MPQRVYNNVEGHRLIDNNRTMEDVTKVGLPTLKHSSSTLSNVSGMAMDIDIPDTTHLEAADFTIYHNNGVNCQYLAQPGKHTIEFRTVRQMYNAAQGTLTHSGVKYRLVGLHMETQKGDIETGSPYGSTEKYSLIRYEEVVGGKTTTVIDAVAGIVKFNGVDYTNIIDNLLK